MNDKREKIIILYGELMTASTFFERIGEDDSRYADARQNLYNKRDAIFDYVHSLEQENQQLKVQLQATWLPKEH